MFDFFKAAFPWIVMGLAIAVFSANHVIKKKRPEKNREDGADEEQGSRLSEGMCLGMCAGVVFGTTGMCDLATGISLGMLLGMVIGMCMKKPC